MEGLAGEAGEETPIEAEGSSGNGRVATDQRKRRGCYRESGKKPERIQIVAHKIVGALTSNGRGACLQNENDPAREYRCKESLDHQPKRGFATPSQHSEVLR